MMLHDLPEAGTEKLFFSDCLPGKPDKNYNPRYAEDSEVAEALWQYSEGLVEDYLAKRDSSDSSSDSDSSEDSS